MELPLEGLKVADFTWVIAGPQLTRCLADFGATVIKVESSTYPDLLRTTPPYKDGIPGWNRSGYFANFNCNKYSITLNLNHPRAREVALRLIRWGDVMVENFTPGTLEKWGLDYESLRRIKPDLIMVSISNQGQTGPYSRLPGIAPNAEAFTGFFHLTGWEDRLPSTSYGFYLDVLAPRLGVSALMAALEHRRRTGEGQHLDISQIEAALYFLSPLLLDCLHNGADPVRQGNRHPWAAPHNAYPCRGEDSWCVIAVTDDAQWQALRRAMGDPEWAADPRFATFLGRKQHEEELDRYISEWTRNFEARELMLLLQSAGVPAGVVQSNEDLNRDPQLRHRGHLWEMEHPEVGRHGYETWGFKLSLTPARPRMPAPCLGEHNEYVYTQVLGFTEEEFLDLLNEGVLD